MTHHHHIGFHGSPAFGNPNQERHPSEDDVQEPHVVDHLSQSAMGYGMAVQPGGGAGGGRATELEPIFKKHLTITKIQSTDRRGKCAHLAQAAGLQKPTLSTTKRPQPWNALRQTSK